MVKQASGFTAEAENPVEASEAAAVTSERCTACPEVKRDKELE